MLEEVIQYVAESFGKGVNEKAMIHFERTVYWLKELKPDADEPMQIAAYAHDIARASRKTNSVETFKDKEFNDSGIIADHQEQGAQIICDFLRKRQYDQLSIDRIYNMVRRHEEGGDSESDLIKDADSLSYLENNVPKFLKIIPALGKGKVGRKITWMYERITLDKAKKIAEPMFDVAIQQVKVA
jgi:Domain of unknown function (DUF4202)